MEFGKGELTVSPTGTTMLLGSNVRPVCPTFTMCTPFTADAEAAALATGVRVEDVVEGVS